MDPSSPVSLANDLMSSGQSLSDIAISQALDNSYTQIEELLLAAISILCGVISLLAGALVILARRVFGITEKLAPQNAVILTLLGQISGFMVDLEKMNGGQPQPSAEILRRLGAIEESISRTKGSLPGRTKS